MVKNRKDKLSVEEFVLLAIEKLRNKKYTGIHVVYSGFNAAFREYFPKLDSVKELGELQKQRKINIFLAKGGVIIYKNKASSNKKKLTLVSNIVLKKMGL